MPNRQYAVIGLGRFGAHVASGLYERGADVVGVDESLDRVDALKDQITTAICANAVSAQTLEELGVEQLDAVVVAMGRDVEASILITAQLKALKARRIIARASSELHAQILAMVGADQVVYPEHDAGARLVRSLASPHIVDVVDLEGAMDFGVVTAPDSFIGESLRSKAVRARYGLTVVGIRQPGQDLQPPDPDYIFGPGDTIYVVGRSRDILAFDGV